MPKQPPFSGDGAEAGDCVGVLHHRHPHPIIAASEQALRKADSLSVYKPRRVLKSCATPPEIITPAESNPSLRIAIELDPVVVPNVTPPLFRILPTVERKLPFRPGGRTVILQQSVTAIYQEFSKPDSVVANLTELVVSGVELVWNRSLMGSAIIGPAILVRVLADTFVVRWIRRGRHGVTLTGGAIQMAAAASNVVFSQWVGGFGLAEGTKLAIRLVISNAVRVVKNKVARLLLQKEPL